MRLILTIICLTTCRLLLGQAAIQSVAAKYLAPGAYSNQFNDVFGGMAQPASLSNIPQSGVGAYGEKRFMLDELGMYRLGSGIKTKSGVFGLGATSFGNTQSRQAQLSLAYGRKLTKTVDIGAAFHYHSISQSGLYGSSSAITGSLALMLHLTDKITAGFNVYNPTRAEWSKVTDAERLPSRYSFGMGYDASENFFIAAELEKEEGQGVNVNLAIHYQFIKQMFVRGGFSSLDAGYFAAVGMQLAGFRLDIATGFHPQLGITPGVLLLYNFGKKDNTHTD